MYEQYPELISLLHAPSQHAAVALIPKYEMNIYAGS